MTETIDSEKVGRKKIRLTKKYTILLVILVLLVGSVVFAVRALNSPAYGTVSDIAAPEPKKIPLKRITGKYISFEYPGRFEEVSNQNQTASLEHWILIARQGLGIGQSGQINMAVSNLPAGGIKETDTYKLHHAFPERYTVTDLEYNHEPVTLTIRTDPTYERIILWPHGKLLLSASLTSSLKNEQLIKELDDLLKGLKWQP
ncbi:hypothetical protein BH10PAT3_BH10PAT3_3010 [soil metagenome]